MRINDNELLNLSNKREIFAYQCLVEMCDFCEERKCKTKKKKEVKFKFVLPRIILRLVARSLLLLIFKKVCQCVLLDRNCF